MMHRVGFFSGWVGDGQINSCYCSFCPSLCLVCRSGQSGPHNFYSRDELAVTVSAPIVRRFVRTSGRTIRSMQHLDFPKNSSFGKSCPSICLVAFERTVRSRDFHGIFTEFYLKPCICPVLVFSTPSDCPVDRSSANFCISLRILI